LYAATGIDYETGTRISPTPENKAGGRKNGGGMSTTISEQSFHISVKSNALILSQHDDELQKATKGAMNQQNQKGTSLSSI
jgi:hypothetical protein